nr:YajG family lipoprotein [Pseudomonas mendocina]
MKFYFILIAAMMLHGCAFTSEVIDITYNPQAGVKSSQEYQEIIVGVSTTDSRADKQRVSSKKNGYGMETAPILSRQDIPTIVSSAIRDELTNRGFRVSQNSPSILLRAEVRRFYNDHKLGFFSGDAVADFEFSVDVVTPDGREIYSRGIVAQGKEENTQLATGNNAALALSKALSDGMSQLFSDNDFVAALSVSDKKTEISKSKEQLLDELSQDDSISYDEYLRRKKIIMRE